MRKLATALIAASVLGATPTAAFASGKGDHKEWRKDHRKAWRDHRLIGPREWRGAHQRYYGARTYPRYDQQAYHDQYRGDRRLYRYYDYDRTGRGGYFADRYYRDGSYYRPRYLSYNDRVYRGLDGRYYCRRDDGTTGLVVGALAGGVLGNAIAPGESKTLGSVLGAVAGGLVGRAIDRDDIRCR